MSIKQPSNTWSSQIEDKTKKEEFVQRLLESRDLFLRLDSIVSLKIKKNSEARASATSYESPAWSEKQADANGYERALTELRSLLNFTIKD